MVLVAGEAKPHGAPSSASRKNGADQAHAAQGFRQWIGFAHALQRNPDPESSLSTVNGPCSAGESARLDTTEDISMNERHLFTFAEPRPSNVTAEVVERFIAAFERKDPSAIPELVAADCVMEAMQPTPNGLRVEGYEANLAFWQAMVSDPNGAFEAINRWRYRIGEDEDSSVRGVTLFVVHDGKIAEALGYAKTAPALFALGQDGASGRTTSDVIARYNDAFERHDAALLSELIAPDCIIENSTPAPSGSRHVGHKTPIGSATEKSSTRRYRQSDWPFMLHAKAVRENRRLRPNSRTNRH